MGVLVSPIHVTNGFCTPPFVPGHGIVLDEDALEMMERIGSFTVVVAAAANGEEA